MNPPVSVPPLAARRFALRALGLETPFPNIATALHHHGYVQIDPINVAGRMHDLILRNRVAGYAEGGLMRHLHGAAAQPLPTGRRTAFEQHLPDTSRVLVAFPLDAWPHLQAEMQARSRRPGVWSGRLTPRERDLAPQLLAEIAARGPLGSEDFEDNRRAHRTVWGSSSLVKSTLQKLFFHGRVLIAHRANNRRRYDLPERVLPAHVLARPAPPAAETARWRALLKLRQRRLVALKRDELRAVEDAVQRVTVEGCPPLYVLRDDMPLLDEIRHSSGGNDPGRVRPASANLVTSSATKIQFLAPLDPLIYDRRLTAALWGFDYTWEAYTPPAKRVRGYYALPILAGTEIVGHVDPKADRENRRLTIVSRRVRRGHALAPALRDFAEFLALHPGAAPPAPLTSRARGSSRAR